MNFDADAFWIGPLVLLIARLLSVEALTARTRRRGGSLVFQATPGTRLILGSGVVGFTAFMIAQRGTDEQWIYFAGAFIVLFCCFSWPTTLVVSDVGVTSQVWWRRSKTIRWEDVSGIEKNRAGDREVFSRKGGSVLFTRYHSAASEFEREIKLRAKLSATLRAEDLPKLNV